MSGVVERLAGFDLRESALVGGSTLVFPSIDDHKLRLRFRCEFLGSCP
jgi:hypothetical protein